MGNTLDRPTLLMKKNLVMMTETTKENLQMGANYGANKM